MHTASVKQRYEDLKGQINFTTIAIMFSMTPS